MKAFIIEDKETVKAIEIDEPSVGNKDVLIDIKYVGLCGSDLSAYRGLMPFVKFPRIPGHEISGTIIKKGDQVPDNYKIGDKATVLPYTSCGHCSACRQGRFNTCKYNETLGVQRDGGLTRQISIPYEKVFTSQTLSFKELVLIEPLSVGYHAANRANVSETDVVLVLGCGTIGMGSLLAAHRKGSTIIALDIDDNKLEIAKKFGATHTINSKKQDALKEIMNITNNDGVNVAIEAAGIPSTIQLALEAVCFAGKIATIGYSKTDVTLNTQLIVKKELDVMGSRNALYVFPSVIKMFEQREKPYIDLISKIYDFKDSKEAFSYWHNNPGEVMKVLIEVN